MSENAQNEDVLCNVRSTILCTCDADDVTLVVCPGGKDLVAGVDRERLAADDDAECGDLGVAVDHEEIKVFVEHGWGVECRGVCCRDVRRDKVESCAT